MPFLVDGHNLVPHVPGLSLSAPDDELSLVELLRSFASRSQRRITVYFDRAAPGNVPQAARSLVTVRFVSLPDTADLAIERHLKRLGKEARNWIVVSSDGEVRHAAQAAGARSQTSQDFARRLLGGGGAPPTDEKPNPPSGPNELKEWASLFNKGRRGRPRSRD